MSELQDTDPMPFGQHKGTPMQDVPVTYLHWLWCNGMRSLSERPASQTSNNIAVAHYIKRSLSGLRMEDKNLIWT